MISRWTYIILLNMPLIQASTNTENQTTQEAVTVLADWNFKEFGTQVTILLFIICVILFRMIYQSLHRFTTWIPESLVLIIAGILFGAVLRALHKDQTDMWKLQPVVFFNYLLPPIVLEAAFAMYDRAVVDYLGAIMLFAVLGSLLNFILIAMPLYGLYLAGAFGGPDVELDAKSFLLFGSFIIAVDPVAVLAIFQEIGVNLGLYYMVFGESLFNDAVTVVLYQVIRAFGGLPQITAKQMTIALFSFFTISFGGVLIGVIGGVITCLITRFPSPMAPLTILVMAYFSYIICDCIRWSGIIALICCGLIQTAYAFHNISRVSLAVVRKVTKTAAELTESIIFLFMGLEVVSRKLEWHTGFCAWSLVLCLLARTVVTVSLAFLLNRGGTEMPKITPTEQIILIYGGLRGAVCFCLAVLVEPTYFVNNGEYKKNVLITGTVFIIFFTNFFMGMTIKPLVMWLQIPMRKQKTLSLFNQLNEHIMDEILVVMETIVGKRGRNVIRDFLIDIDNRYIRRILQRDPETQDQKFVKLYEKIALKIHYATIQPGQSEIYLNRLAPNLKQQFTVERKSSLTSISNSLLPESILAADLKSVKTEELKENSSDSVDADSQSESANLRSVKSCGPVCIGKIARKKRPTLESSEGKSLLSMPRQSILMGPVTDDGVNMRQYLRSSRYASVASSNDTQESEFADNFMQVLRTKSMAASRIQRHRELTNEKRAQHTDHARTSADSSQLPSLLIAHEVPPTTKMRKRVTRKSRSSTIGLSALPTPHSVAPKTVEDPANNVALIESQTVGQVSMQSTERVTHRRSAKRSLVKKHKG